MGNKFTSQSVGRKLREIRKRRGVTSAEHLCDLMGCRYSASGILRREEGRLKIDFTYLEEFCAALKLPEVEKEHLLTRARLNVWHSQRSVLDISREMSELLKRATKLRAYGFDGIPNELQTYEYVEAVVSSYAAYGDIEERARLRFNTSQDLLGDKRKTIELVLHENVLYTPIGRTEVMLAQLEHLNSVKLGLNCEFRILPRMAVINVPKVLSFAIIDNAFAVGEARNGMITSEDDAIVDELNKDFGVLWQHSVMGEERERLIANAIAYYQAFVKPNPIR